MRYIFGRQQHKDTSRDVLCPITLTCKNENLKNHPAIYIYEEHERGVSAVFEKSKMSDFEKQFMDEYYPYENFYHICGFVDSDLSRCQIIEK